MVMVMVMVLMVIESFSVMGTPRAMEDGYPRDCPHPTRLLFGAAMRALPRANKINNPSGRYFTALTYLLTRLCTATAAGPQRAGP